MLYSYDYSTQTIFAYSHSNLSCSVYKIGQLFVNFLNNDYQKYDEKNEWGMHCGKGKSGVSNHISVSIC